MINIPFNRPYFTGEELDLIKDAISSGKIAGDGKYTHKCQELMEKEFNAKKIFLTNSCTDALEMAAILLNIKQGDEVIVPSFTFTSTINAFILMGAKPVFVDIRKDTLNMDENLIEDKITDKTKVIVPVHYAGISCDMDKINKIAKSHGISTVEDAAQGVNAKYKDNFLGTIGDLGAFSFHETKNYVSGEGGAIVINNESLRERAEIVREKGTNRNKFIRGEVDKYTWVDIGSSYLLSDILAALLYSQLTNMDSILNKRNEIYDYYQKNLTELESKGKMTLPIIPKECKTNYHCFYILLNNEKERDRVMMQLKKKGIQALFHYIPLHNSPMGRSFGYNDKDLPITESISSRILRLPLYADLKINDVDHVLTHLFTSLGENYTKKD